MPEKRPKHTNVFSSLSLYSQQEERRYFENQRTASKAYSSSVSEKHFMPEKRPKHTNVFSSLSLYSQQEERRYFEIRGQPQKHTLALPLRDISFLESVPNILT